MTEAIKKTLKDSATMRWFVLILVSGLMVSTYWFQDFFSGLKDLMESQMGFTSEEFGRLIGLTTIANVFGMIIVGGILLDKWGIRVAGLIFGGIAALGGAITALASAGYFGEEHSTILSFMIVGRVLFGSGLEVVCVVVTYTTVKWFKGYELALALAIGVGFGRLGSAMGIALSRDIGGATVPPAVAFAATLIGIALIMFVVYLIFDVKLDKQLKGETKDSEEEFKFSDLIKLVTNRSFIYIALLCVAFYVAVFPFMQYAPDLLVNKYGFSSELPESANILLFGNPTLGNASVYLVLFIFAICFSAIPSNIEKLSYRYGFIGLVFILFLSYLYSIGPEFKMWLQNGQKTASLIPLGTILFTPVFGTYVDKKGKAASLMILGSLLLIFTHLSLSVFNNVVLAYFGLLSLGIAFSLVPAAMWPSIAKIVAASRLGTAYSAMFTVQNWGLLLFYWGIGAALDWVNSEKLEAIRSGTDTYDYTKPILILVGCGIISIFLAFKLKASDKKHGHGLELPSGAKAPKEKEVDK